MSGKPRLKLLQNLEKVLTYLEAKRISQVGFAAQVGLSPTQLNRVLRGHSDVTLDTLGRMAEVMGCEVYDLMLPPDRKVVTCREAEALQKIQEGFAALQPV